MASNIKKKTLEEKLMVRGKKAKNFVGARKIFFGISLAIILIGIVCNFIFGTTMDIQFTGGSMLKYSYSGSLDDAKLKKLGSRELQLSQQIYRRVLHSLSRRNSPRITSSLSRVARLTLQWVQASC